MSAILTERVLTSNVSLEAIYTDPPLSFSVVSTELFSEVKICYYESALRLQYSAASDCLICSLEMSLDYFWFTTWVTLEDAFIG